MIDKTILNTAHRICTEYDHVAPVKYKFTDSQMIQFARTILQSSEQANKSVIGELSAVIKTHADTIEELRTKLQEEQDRNSRWASIINEQEVVISDLEGRVYSIIEATASSNND